MADNKNMHTEGGMVLYNKVVGNSMSVMMDSVAHGVCRHCDLPVYIDLSLFSLRQNTNPVLHVVSVHILHNMLKWVHRHIDESTSNVHMILIPCRV